MRLVSTDWQNREPWMTKKQIAAHLQVSVRTVERLRLPFTRVGGQNRYKVSEVERALGGNADEADNVVQLRPPRGSSAA
jgi:excisionase family DNA binding protein